MQYEIKYKREWFTYVTIEAESQDEAQQKFNEMLDNGDVYEIELDQCNVQSEGIVSIVPITYKFTIPAK
jgi:hypothetical protein